MKNKLLGVIGGLGPMATVYFMELVVKMTDAASDQENLDMILYNLPSIPDRTGYILGNSDKNPLPLMIAAGRELERQKAACIAMPCVTAHYFHRELQSALKIPVINGVYETVCCLKRKNIKRVGLMATDGTIRSNLLSRELDNAGLVPVIPSGERQKDIMHLIYENVKAGKPPEMDRFERVRRELLDCGVEAITLACTELSLIKRDRYIGGGFIDVLEVLARESVIRCGKRLRAEYNEPILTERSAYDANKYPGISGANRSAFAG